MQFQGYATSTLPVGSLRACGGERLAALQPSSAAHGVQPPVSSRSVPMHQLLLPQLMGLLAISKLRDKHSTNGESEGMGKGVPSGALTLVVLSVRVLEIGLRSSTRKGKRRSC